MRSHRPEIIVRIDGEDVSSMLGDLGSVSVTKSLYNPFGEFRAMFPDMPYAGKNGNRDSLYGHVRVMAPVEILMRRDGDFIPTLRGFVRSVTRDEQVLGDGRPHRAVTVIGHDTGAAFIMEQLSALISWQNSGVYPQALAWMREYAVEPKPYPVADFLWDVASKSTESILAAGGFAFERVMSVADGFVIPYIAMSTDGPVWALLKRYSDAPWNEFFVREGPTGPQLVFRQTPWIDVALHPIHGVAIEDPVRLELEDIVNLTAHRDDAELVNHVWVSSPAVTAAALVQPLVQSRGIINHETRATFGDRLQQLQTFLGPTRPIIGGAQGEHEVASADWAEWILKRLDWASRAGEHVEKLERGRLSLKGRPELRVGDYAILRRGSLEWVGYATTVHHDFQPFKRYMTTVDYIRGTQYLVRRNTPAPWEGERRGTLL